LKIHIGIGKLIIIIAASLYSVAY